VGLTAYSQVILQKVRALVIRREWFSEEEVNEGLALGHAEECARASSSLRDP